MTSFAKGDRVTDTNGSTVYTGTVQQTVGTMFKDTAVLVSWDGLAGSNWESPNLLTLIAGVK